MKDSNLYVPYGEEWEKEMMKLSKKFLINMIRKNKEDAKQTAIEFDKYKRDNRYIWDFWDNDTEKYYAAWDDYKSYTTEQLFDLFNTNKEG